MLNYPSGESDRAGLIYQQVAGIQMPGCQADGPFGERSRANKTKQAPFYADLREMLTSN